MNVKIFVILLCIIFHRINGISHEKDLSQLAVECQTDKGPISHNYTPIYDQFFTIFRTKPVRLLEIGFLIGDSARMWDAYFENPNASLSFIDINQPEKHCMRNLSSRCSLHIADQAQANQLLTFIKKGGGSFDIIIDDGGHMMEQQLVSFKILFPYLNQGGIYVIEDLHTSYWSKFGSAGTYDNPKASPASMIKFLQCLVDDMNYCSARLGVANKCPEHLQRTLNLYQKEISSIHFYPSLCIVCKK